MSTDGEYCRVGDVDCMYVCLIINITKKYGIPMCKLRTDRCECTKLHEVKKMIYNENGNWWKQEKRGVAVAISWQKKHARVNISFCRAKIISKLFQNKASSADGIANFPLWLDLGSKLCFLFELCSNCSDSALLSFSFFLFSPLSFSYVRIWFNLTRFTFLW